MESEGWCDDVVVGAPETRRRDARPGCVLPRLESAACTSP